ncbi:MAG: protein kinase domain-containing protein [Aureliella sp.]
MRNPSNKWSTPYIPYDTNGNNRNPHESRRNALVSVSGAVLRGYNVRMPIQPDEPTRNELSEDRTRADSGLSFDAASSTGDQSRLPQQTIGRYRLLNLVGKGGMGQVWRAAQEEPVRRTVALKLMGSNAGKDALGRFEAERQAIAMMDHPNIAKILDADTTEDGNPYFVMELVKGVPFDQYCNKRKLALDDRLRLMIPVCKAVQHAHQKAIIHRDLKHSNILVGENDNNPTPKVIDFGLAKAMDSRNTLTDTTVYTEYGKVVGTIAYMSPEQADSDEQDIDTRSDIYSLGVVLYKLLTGKTPLQVDGTAHSMMGALQIIKEKDACPPSQALRSAKNSDTWTQENTTLTLEKYSEQIKGDLDSIVLKALEKDRRERYATANEFAEDIERYLNKEPILARPRSAFYTVRKFVQRNRGLVASVLAIMTLLIGGIIGTSNALLYALKAQRLTNTQLWALRLKSTWNDWNAGNTQSAWQTLRAIDQENASWPSRYLANELFTCDPSDILHGHAFMVLTTDISPDGKLILSGGSDDAVYLWDGATNNQLGRLLTDDIVTCVRFSPDGSTFAVADRSNRVSRFDTATLARLKTYGPFEQDVSSVVYHPSQPVMIFGFSGNDSSRAGMIRHSAFEKNQAAQLMAIEVESGDILDEVDAHTNEVTSLEFNKPGDMLLSCSMDGMLKIWKYAIGTESKKGFETRHEIKANPGGVHELSLSPDASQVVCVGEDKVANLYSTQTGALINRFAGHSARTLGVDFSPDGKLIATAARDQTAIIWDLEGKIIKVCKGHSGPINEIRFFPDSRRLITASDDLTLRRWSLDKPGASARTTEIPNIAQWQADFSPNKATVALAGDDGVITLLDTETGKVKKRLRQDGAALCLVWLDDGRLITAGEGKTLRVWNNPHKEDALLEPSRTIDIAEDAIWDISVSPDQESIAVAGSSPTARVLDAISFETKGELVGHQEGLASARFSGDGRFLVTACDDQTAKVWDAKTFQLLKTLAGHSQPVWRAVFSPTDSNLIATSCADGSLLLWDWPNASVRVEFDGHASQIAGLTFTPDGKCLVSASDDGTAMVWDIELGVNLFAFEERPSRPVIEATFSKDGQTLVTAGMGTATIRHARPVFAPPYLRRDATEDMHRFEFRVIEQDLSKSELEDIERFSAKACQVGPSYVSYRNVGIAQCRLGKYSEAIKSLRESQRVQKVAYGGDDVRPLTEAYLAIALLKSEQAGAAIKAKAEFDAIAESWPSDPRVQLVRRVLRDAFSQ